MGNFADKVDKNEKDVDFTMVKKINRTLKAVRVENELLRLVDESGRTFTEVVNTAIRKELIK